MWIEGKPKKGQTVEQLKEDPDGSTTIMFLREVRKAAWLISGDQSGSLGLHPVVYFWGATGVFQPPAFIAAIKFMRQLEERKQLIKFTSARMNFEEFLVKNKAFVNALIHAKGSRSRPVDSIVSLYEIILTQISSGVSEEQAIVDKLMTNENLSKAIQEVRDDQTRYRKRFSKEAKTGAFLRDAIDSAHRCAECGARMHSKSMCVDHKHRIQDGGDGSPDNAQWMHYFCNNSAKELRIMRERCRIQD